MNEPVINELGINNADTYINEFGGLVTDNGHASAEIVIKMTEIPCRIIRRTAAAGSDCACFGDGSGSDAI